MKEGNAALEIDRVNRFGEVFISFNETMFVPTKWDEINSTVLNISLKVSNVDMLPFKDSEWKVLDYSTREMTIAI